MSEGLQRTVPNKCCNLYFSTRLCCNLYFSIKLLLFNCQSPSATPRLSATRPFLGARKAASWAMQDGNERMELLEAGSHDLALRISATSCEGAMRKILLLSRTSKGKQHWVAKKSNNKRRQPRKSQQRQNQPTNQTDKTNKQVSSLKLDRHGRAGGLP